MFYSNDEQQRLNRQLKRLTEENDEINALLLKMSKDIENIQIKNNEYTDKLNERIEQLENEINELYQSNNNDINNISTDVNNLSMELDSMTEMLDKVGKDNEVIITNQNRAIEQALKHVQHVTRFDQGIPRAEIISSYVDEQGKLNTEIHWNNEFIQNLVNSGFVGKNDNEIVQQWINNLLYQFREEEQSAKK